MAWDSTRPVPWQRLVREWLIYVGIMAILFLVFFRDRGLFGIFAGLLVSGPLYLAFGYGMAKLGYQRKSLRQLRDEPRRPRAERTEPTADVERRPKPPPTKRTGGGGAARPGGTRRKRR